MISMAAAPTAPTGKDCHTIAGVSEKLKKVCPNGVVNARAAIATMDASSSIFHGRNGRDSTTRIQNAVTSSAMVAAEDGCQQMTLAVDAFDSVCTRHSEAGERRPHSWPARRR